MILSPTLRKSENSRTSIRYYPVKRCFHLIIVPTILSTATGAGVRFTTTQVEGLSTLCMSVMLSPFQYTTQWFACLVLQMNLSSLIQHEIHVFIKPNDVSFDTNVGLFVQPYLYTCTTLKVTKDQVDRLNHHLLNFLHRHRHLVV